MNNGVRYGHRFADPPSLQKDIFILSSKIYKTITQYKNDPEYSRYYQVIERLSVMNNYMNEIISYMLELDEQERQIDRLEKQREQENQKIKIANKNELQNKNSNKLEIVLQDDEIIY